VTFKRTADSLNSELFRDNTMARNSGSDPGRGNDRYDDFPNNNRGRGGQGGSGRGINRYSQGGWGAGYDQQRDEVFRGESMEVNLTTPLRQTGNPPEARPVEAAKRTVEDRSPQDSTEVRNVRRRLNEFDIGEVFSGIEATLTKSVEDAIAATPDQLKEPVRKGFSGVLKAMQDMMNGLSDAFQADRIQVESLGDKMETKVTKVQEKLEEVINITDSLARTGKKVRTRESIKEMESKVKEADCALKLLNIDIGRVADDRREMVKRTIEVTRSWVKEDDQRHFDRVIRRTRSSYLVRVPPGARMMVWRSSVCLPSSSAGIRGT
jgi:hypothetical protein